MSDRPLVQQIPLFAVVGAAATATHVAVALAARNLAALSPLAANVAGWACAVGVSYLGNAGLTFGRPALHGPQFARFVAVSLAGLALTQAVTWLVVQQMGQPFGLAMGAVAVATPALSFVLSRLWVFRHRA